MTISLTDTQTQAQPTWCPGCGDFRILLGIKKALVAMGKPLHASCIISGIGCSGKLNHYVNTYGFESLHGRTQPVMTGVHLANHKLNVVAVGGDGDGYGIGLGHLMHTMRRNMNMMYIVHDNQIYGLTTGQYSPTTRQGTKTASSPFGSLETPVNPVKLALASDGISFIARGFAGDVDHLYKLIQAGMEHEGFALIDVLQPCTTFNKINTYDFYKERVYKLEEDASFDKTNKDLAMKRSEEWGERIPIGIFYQANLPLYEASLPAIQDKALVEHDINNINITGLYKEFI
ncbi:MAG: thiamine pyrophosphate-dependent enzyme [Patescibacteria group bacterium]|jgi:2-oxoglutarate ferredoxin oxidoreductase subunit beta